MAFAQPAEEAAPPAGKKPEMKEFKIYRWVSYMLWDGRGDGGSAGDEGAAARVQWRTRA
jgi:hypothetical protein